MRKRELCSVAVVHQNWLTPRKKEVYLPPYKTQALYDKAVKKGDSCTEDWQLFTVKRIFRYYDSFEKAQVKAKVAEVTSDLQSEVDEVNSEKKRQRIKPRRFIYSDTESEEDSLPRPPKICKVALNLKPHFQVHIKDNLTDDVECGKSAEPSNLDKHRIIHPRGTFSTTRPIRVVFKYLIIMSAIVGALVGLGAVVGYFLGWIFLVQLVIVAAVAYIAAGHWRWWYVAVMTAPRDLR
ncbi:unnamed protein product [Diabrotica balteata]|uniref:Uncharacterized protein n=1 Tax=Diabrotica balteata TaxID=107213 RepID=A0A9N9T7V5_DIABA|nr:unnamed protein product [Diabrotica balteata]